MLGNLRDRGPSSYEGDHHGGPTPDEDRPWYARVGFILSAALIAAVLLLLVRLVWFTDDPSVGPGAPGGPAAPPAAEAGGCPAFPSPAPPPPTSRAAATWRFLGNGVVEAPTVNGLGPALTRPVTNPLTGQAGQLPACYAEGPGGAVLAGANWLAALTDPALIDAAIRDLTAPSAGRDAMITKLESDSAALNASGSAGYSFTGYKLDAPADTQVTVIYRLLTQSGAIGTTTITVVRGDDDWYVVPPPSGDLQDVSRPITGTTAGFTDWK